VMISGGKPKNSEEILLQSVPLHPPRISLQLTGIDILLCLAPSLHSLEESKLISFLTTFSINLRQRINR
jgi:hypothetical protein